MFLKSNLDELLSNPLADLLSPITYSDNILSREMFTILIMMTNSGIYKQMSHVSKCMYECVYTLYVLLYVCMCVHTYMENILGQRLSLYLQIAEMFIINDTVILLRHCESYQWSILAFDFMQFYKLIIYIPSIHRYKMH